MDRKLILFCGVGSTGKSFWSKIILAFLAADKPLFVDLDTVRISRWGKKELTDAEHLLKNDLTRMEVKNRFIIDKAKTVVLVATTLTEESHQKPLIEMLKETEKILESAEGRPVKIKLYAIWCDCDIQASEKRILARQKDLSNTDSNVVDMSILKNNRRRFEPPGKYYPYLKIDTSDDSPEADVERFRKIIDFISN